LVRKNRKVKRVGESEKWVTSDKTQGGGVKKKLFNKNENDWWEGKRSENRFKKT
jgi:hypothetical protein